VRGLRGAGTFEIFGLFDRSEFFSMVGMIRVSEYFNEFS